MILPSGAVVDCYDRGGEYHVHVTAPDRSRYPMRGGQGDYEPRDVWLTWTTEDGVTWTFGHADIRGPHVEKRTGETGSLFTSQRISLNDTTYADCEPHWLADLVKAMAPKEPAA